MLMAYCREMLLHELQRYWRQRTDLLRPLNYSLLILLLFPLLFGTQREVLQTLAPGAVMLIMMLSITLNSEQFLSEEWRCGCLEQWLLHAFSPYFLLLIKLAVYWFASIAPLIALTPLFALLLYFPVSLMPLLLLAMLLATPIMCAFTALAASLGLATQARGIFTQIIALPLFVPLVIFIVEMFNTAGQGEGGNVGFHLLWLGAMVLLCTALTPGLLLLILRAILRY